MRISDWSSDVCSSDLDLAALEALAVRRGRDLAAEGVVVVSVGGATSIGRFLDHFGPAGLDLTLAGVCDLGEVGAYRRALERAEIGRASWRARVVQSG